MQQGDADALPLAPLPPHLLHLLQSHAQSPGLHAQRRLQSAIQRRRLSGQFSAGSQERLVFAGE